MYEAIEHIKFYPFKLPVLIYLSFLDPENKDCYQFHPYPDCLNLPPDYEWFVTRMCMNSCDETFPFHVETLDDACYEDPNNFPEGKYSCCSNC